jgi:hypothetical protein
MKQPMLVNPSTSSANTAARPVLRSITTSPFSFRFDTEPNRSYSIEGSSDLKAWGVVKTYNGTGTMIQFVDERDQVFPQIYYRVRVAE